MPTPRQVDNVSEMGRVLKTRYPTPRQRRDPYGLRYRKGFRTHLKVGGRRPLVRSPLR